MPKQRTRRSDLIRAGAALVAAAFLLGPADELARLLPGPYGHGPAGRLATALLAAWAGAVAVRNGVIGIFGGLHRQAAVVWRNVATWILYGLLGLLVASALGVNLSGLLLGGAILGVVVAAISQATLGNFFAGLVLMFARPYAVGGTLRVRGPMLGPADVEGTVTDLGALHTTLVTAEGDVVKVPNAAVVGSTLVVGRAPMRAEVELELPPGRPLEPIVRAVQEKLNASPAEVTVQPRRVTAGDPAAMVFSLQVRSSRPFESALLAEALAGAASQG